MLEMTKNVLTGVSFDETLFRKELSKSKRWLKHDEISHLRIWCLASFAVYTDIITEVFN